MTDFTSNTAITGHPIHALADRLLDRVRQRRRRRGFKRLLDLDDQMLDDLGVLRHEVVEASHLPLSVDAATELRRVSLERRRKLM